MAEHLAPSGYLLVGNGENFSEVTLGLTPVAATAYVRADAL
jgi:hypothetical protein